MTEKVFIILRIGRFNPFARWMVRNRHSYRIAFGTAFNIFPEFCSMMTRWC